MLSDHEQRMWDDIERFYAAEAAEPDRGGLSPLRWWERDSGELEDLPALVAVGIWITIMLILFGAPGTGLAVAVATALRWRMWQARSLPSGAGATAALPVTGEADARDGAA